MKHVFSVLLFLLTTISSFAQFPDTAQLNSYIRDTIQDRRPDKITAAQIQKAFLGITQFLGESDSSVFATQYYVQNNFYPLSSNPVGYLTEVTDSQVMNALGFTPYGAIDTVGTLSTKTYRQKGVDSVIGYVAGNYLPLNWADSQVINADGNGVVFNNVDSFDLNSPTASGLYPSGTAHITFLPSKASLRAGYNATSGAFSPDSVGSYSFDWGAWNYNAYYNRYFLSFGMSDTSYANFGINLGLSNTVGSRSNYANVAFTIGAFNSLLPGVGYDFIYGYANRLTGDNSVLIGNNNLSVGSNIMVLGSANVGYANGSTVGGYADTTSSGATDATVFGNQNRADGYASFTTGLGLKNKNNFSLLTGLYNDTTVLGSMFAIGRGTPTARKTIFSIDTNGVAWTSYNLATGDSSQALVTSSWVKQQHWPTVGNAGISRISPIDSLSHVSNGIQLSGQNVVPQTVDESNPGFMSALDKRKLDSLYGGLIFDTTHISHITGTVYDIYPSSDNRSIVDKGWKTGDAYVRTNTDSSNYIVLKANGVTTGSCTYCTVTVDSAGRVTNVSNGDTAKSSAAGLLSVYQWNKLQHQLTIRNASVSTGDSLLYGNADTLIAKRLVIGPGIKHTVSQDSIIEYVDSNWIKSLAGWGGGTNYSSGTFTPTVISNSNATAVTVHPANYIKAGNIVTVYGTLSAEEVAAGTVSVTLSLPFNVSSTFTQTYQLTGLINGTTNLGQVGVTGPAFSVSNGGVALKWTSSDDNSDSFNYTYSYQIY